MAITLGKSMKPQKLTKKNIPVKRSINLAHAGEKKSNIRVGILVLILVTVGVGVAAKFAILDRFIEVDHAREEVAAVQRQINAGYDKIDSYGELAIKYAHFTYSGMKPEELSLADRVAVVEMIDRLVLPTNYVEGWSLRGNLLTLSISGNTLQELNLVTQRLELDELVDFCTVTTASTSDIKNLIAEDAYADVVAQIVVHLKSSEEVHW